MATVTTPANAAAPQPRQWEPKQPPLSTPWTAQVGPDNALPEYPRPQLQRPRWQNLNGLWSYTTGARAQDTAPPTAEQFSEQILVPYPPESALSGIQRHDDQMWYRRTFTVPPDWQGQRLLLHFGAVDQTATVWVNNQEVARHEGGYTSFSADVTDALRANGEQELVVAAEDRNDSAPFPVGKQRNHPGGIMYTGASGIWQTVWLEPVPLAHVSKVDITPDLTGFAVTPRVSAATTQRAEVVVSERDGGPEVARSTGPAGEQLRIAMPNPRLWTPEDPYLYDITVRLRDQHDQVVDEVTSYAGLRTVSLVNDEQGRPRIALNGRITFLHGPLDQGYWPDGIYTAPTDEALKFDLDKTKELGFNFVRKHVKVEPARWYYWADRLGLLVWQDMPSLPFQFQPPGPQPPPPAPAQAHFEQELAAMIDQLRSVTSIIAWVPFNEGWGEYDTARIAAEVKAADPSRQVNPNSGVNCCFSHPDTRTGEIYDDHTYVGPGRPQVLGRRAVVDGEYGGLGLKVEGHMWPGTPGAYEMTDSPDALTRRYVEVSHDLEDVVRTNGISGGIYTQTTDVENEVNGFYTYDRKVLKPHLAPVVERNRAVIAAGSR